MLLGGDFAFRDGAAWQIAEAHGAHVPTYVYRYDYAPRTLHWSGSGATHAMELLAVFDIYRTRFGGALTVGIDRPSAAAGEPRGGHSLAQLQPDGCARRGLADLFASGATGAGVRRHTHVEYDPHAHRREAWAGFSLAGR